MTAKGEMSRKGEGRELKRKEGGNSIKDSDVDQRVIKRKGRVEGNKIRENVPLNTLELSIKLREEDKTRNLETLKKRDETRKNKS